MYGEWIIGGVAPTFNINADYSDLANGRLTLHCLAEGDGNSGKLAEIIDEFSEHQDTTEQTMFVGTFNVKYHPGDQVILANSDGDLTKNICVDDHIELTANGLTVSESYGLSTPPWVEAKPPLDISNILLPGTNVVDVTIKNVGPLMGSDPLALFCIGTDPRDEIKQFIDMQCTEVTNTKLINGGSKVQVTGGEVIDITDGFYEWKGAIEIVRFKEDDRSKRFTEFDIILQVEKQGDIPPTIYTPPYCNVPNIDYQEFTDVTQGSSSQIVVHENTLYKQFAVTKYAGNVTQKAAGGCSKFTQWNNISAIKARDNNYAYAYMNEAQVGCSNQIIGDHFGFNIPAKAIITRVVAYVKYANNSKLRSPYFNKPEHTLIISGPGLYLSKKKNYAMNRTPEKPDEAWFDSKAGDFKCPTNVSSLNNSSFSVIYAATLDKYKTVWVDGIYVQIEYKLKLTDLEDEVVIIKEPLIQEGVNEECYAIGSLRIVETDEVKKVRVSGSACNGQAWIELNGIRKEWHVSHDTAHGNPLPQGTEVMEWVLKTPTNILEFKTSTHRKYGDPFADNKGCVLDWIEVFYK